MKKSGKDNHIFPFLWMRGETEEVLRREMRKIAECSIRSVCVEARPHPDFCGPGWWHDMDIILDEAEKRNMTVWILDDKHFPTGYANGLIEKCYPERKKVYINYSSADIFGAKRELTLNVKEMLKPLARFWETGKPCNQEEREKNEFLALVALKFCHGHIFEEETIDLSDTFDGVNATFTLPEGQWKVYAVYRTRTDGGDEAYINLIDEKSARTQIEGVYEEHFKRYGEKFGTVIAGFFSDEPQFGNISGFAKDAVIGRKEMPLPWSDELEQMLTEKYGTEYRQLLPFLWADSDRMQKCPKIRYDYMDSVSKLYRKNFSCAIGKWCEDHGVEYIGHVVEDDGCHSRLGMGAAHYFRAMSGQHMAGIDCIGGQIVFGAPDARRTGMVESDGEFYHYLIAKMGASCGHLDPGKKGRTMCELFGAYGWQFGVRDMKYVLDHLLTKGINYLVPHAFSMAAYPDPDCPPHFYAGGNHPQFSYFSELMKYADRMCRLFSGGTHVATAAVLYDAEAEWCGQRMPMQKAARELLEHQIDFDIVSLDMLTEEAAYFGMRTEGGKLIIHDESFDVLIVPYIQRITKELETFIGEHPEVPVWFVHSLPEATVNGSGGEISEKTAACKVVPLEELAAEMKKNGWYDVSLKKACTFLSAYHYRAETERYLFLNESAEHTFAGEILLPTDKELVICKKIDGRTEKLAAGREEGGSSVRICLYPGESCVICEVSDKMMSRPVSDYIPEDEREAHYQKEIQLSEGWTYSKVRAIDYPDFTDEKTTGKLRPISEDEPDFSGIIRYKKKFKIDAVPVSAEISFEHVFEAMTLWVNGEKAGICLRPPYKMEIGNLLRTGENEICAEVATTPVREQSKYPQPPFKISHIALEPAGMYGEVKLLF